MLSRETSTNAPGSAAPLDDEELPPMTLDPPAELETTAAEEPLTFPPDELELDEEEVEVEGAPIQPAARREQAATHRDRFMARPYQHVRRHRQSPVTHSLSHTLARVRQRVSTM